MSTISSVSSNQLFTTTPSNEPTTNGKGVASSRSNSKTNEQSLFQPSSPKTPFVKDILGMLKKVLEVVTTLLQLYGKESSDSSVQGGSTSKNPSHEPSLQHCGETIQKSVPTGSTLHKSGEFLWKPKSDKDGKLAILLPSALEGQVDSVSVISPSGTVSTGKYAGVGNGSREHFRFTRPGGDFQDGSKVVITMKDGSLKEVQISDSSARYQM
jgi:hypothetical protein